MQVFLQIMLTNVALAAVMTPAAWLASRLTRWPGVGYAAWIIVLLRLVMPPLIPFPLSLPVVPVDRQLASSTPYPELNKRPPDAAPAVVADTVAPSVVGPPANEARTRSPVQTPSNFDWHTALFSFWAAGCCLWIALITIRVRRFQVFVHDTEPAPAKVQQAVERCAAVLGMRRSPEFRIVEGRIPPLVWAVKRPLVLLPASLIHRLEEQQLETLIAHELAHVRRGDHWVRRLELAVIAVHWWNPLAWWIRARLQESEEACCDAIVTRAFSGHVRQYGQALLETIQFLSEDRRRPPILATGFGRTRSIKRRIAMILDGGAKDQLSRRAKLALGVVAVCALGATVRLATAEQKPSTGADDANKAAARDAPKARADVDARATIKQASDASSDGVRSAVGSAASAQDSPADPKANKMSTEAVKRGDLELVVRATGTIEPEEVVDVSAAVAGTVKRFGPDLRAATDPQFKGKSIDYNSPVEPGTVLAQLDDALYQARFDEAKAGCQRALAELDEAKAKLERTEADLKRVRGHVEDKIISVAEADTAETTQRVAKSAVAAAEAVIAQQQAVLKQAEINLAATSIKSPIKGIVIDRRVNVGQTVEPNLNAHSLFLVAKDSKRLQIWASVNEADIGKIHEKQSVRFTVDAFPRKVFEGQVAQTRLNAQMTQNVVTYTVVITADNADGRLLPYLTASVAFDAGHRHDVLLVPNAALRWRPASKMVGAGAETGPARDGEHADGSQLHRVWIQEGQSVRPVDVQVGLSDGTLTEITGGDLKEGARVVVGEDAPNPFTPRVKKNAPPQ